MSCIFPRGQLTQYVAKLWLIRLSPYLFTAHAVQAVMPALGWNLPLGQTAQPSGPAPYAGFALPGGQGSHSKVHTEEVSTASGSHDFSRSRSADDRRTIRWTRSEPFLGAVPAAQSEAVTSILHLSIEIVPTNSVVIR